MRNDAHDELDNIPSLTAGRDRDPYPAPELEPINKPARSVTDDSRVRQKRRGPSTAPLWILIIVLFGLLVGLGWWGLQQVARLEAQLVATQESFAKISEDATGRLQDISGKIVATESSVTTEGEALKLRIKQLEKQALDLAEHQRALGTQQQSLTGRQTNQDKRLHEQGARVERLASDVGNSQTAVVSLGDRVKNVADEQAALKTSIAGVKGAVDDLGGLSARIDSLNKDLAALKQRGDYSQAISRLEQDVLVLRSEMDNRPAAAPGLKTEEFDSFRAQVTRTINGLQGQVANLQQQINQR